MLVGTAAASKLAACLLSAASLYHVPPAVMIGIMQVEGGHVGQAAGPNFNGTYDLGPMQVNTSWMPALAQTWHVTPAVAHQWVKDDGCTNVYVAAWILKQKIAEGGSLYGGIAHYHSATPAEGNRYASKVILAMDKRGLLKHDAALPSFHYNEIAQR